MAMCVIAVVGEAPCQCFSPDAKHTALHPRCAGYYDQRPAQWMRMPHGAGARLERHAGAADARWSRRFEQRIDPDPAG
jgi:hypothetical protein